MVLDVFFRIGTTGVIQHISATMLRIIYGFVLGCFGGIIMGLAMSWNKDIYKIFYPIIEIIRPIPPYALIPFFILWFGIADIGKVLLITEFCFVVLVVETVEAVKNFTPIYLRASRTLGANKVQRFRFIIIPGIIPELTASLRIASAGAFGLAIAAEFMGAQVGLGYMIMVARRTLNTDVILFGIVIIAILSWLMDQVMRLGTDYLTQWKERE